MAQEPVVLADVVSFAGQRIAPADETALVRRVDFPDRHQIQVFRGRIDAWILISKLIKDLRSHDAQWFDRFATLSVS